MRISSRARPAFWWRALLLMSLAALGRPAIAVHYVDVPDLPVTEDGLLLKFLGSEILLQRDYVILPDSIRRITYAGNIWGDGGVAVQGKGSVEALPIDRGSDIGPQLFWSGLSTRLVYVSCPKTPGECASTGAWAGREYHLGLLFRDEFGAHYGWARLGHAGADAPVILYEYAVETIPDRPILAGSIATLSYEATRALKYAAGIDAAAPGDIALLDRAGIPGQVDVPDAIALLRLLIPPSRA